MRVSRYVGWVATVMVLVGCTETGKSRPGAEAGRSVGSKPAAAGSVPGSGSPRPAACPASGVMVLSDTEPDAAMGLRVLSITLLNCGTRPYALDGYPAVRLLGANRTPLIVTVRHGSSPIATIDAFAKPAEPVTLRPGGRASAGLVWRNLVTDSTIPQTEGVYLEVSPAGAEPAQTVVPRGGIDLGNTSQIGLSPWKGE